MECVYAKRIFTGKSVIENGFLLFSQGKVVGFATAPRGKLLGKFPVLTPAFIDPHSHIGMVRAGEPGSESESNDHLDAILVLPDALDSIQMDDAAFAEAVEDGVLYSCVLPGSGNIVGGLSAVVRHYARNTSEALVARAGVKAAFGYNPMSAQSWKGTRPTTRMGAMALLRKRFDDVREKMEKRRRARGKKKEEIVFGAEEAALRDLLEGKTRLRAHVHKSDDIAMLLRLVDQYKIRVSVEHAMDVNAPETFRELRRRRIPVTYGPLDAFAYKVELKHAAWRNVRFLLESGVAFGLMTDHPVTASRSLLLQTRWLLRAGLTKQQAIEIVSRRNAEILGIDHLLGTLANGKWASFTCWSGDPFDLASRPVAVYGEGRRLFAE